MEADSLPPVSDQELAELRNLSDERIDTGDDPPFTDEDVRAGRAPLVHSPRTGSGRETVTVRLDKDLADRLRNQAGQVDEERLNRALRRSINLHPAQD